MNSKRGLRDRRFPSSALALVLASLVVGGLIAGGASATPPQNAAAYNEVGGLPTISHSASTATCPTCGADTPRVGDTLTAGPGTWSQAPPPTTFSYEWKRCAIDDTACAAITGATSANYVVVGADVTHVLAVTVTARNADGSGTATSLPTGIVASAAGPRPVAAPTLTGLVIVGKQLSVSGGVWTPPASAFAVQWQRCSLDSATSTASGLTYTRLSAAVGCVNVPGATKATYSVTSADIAHRVRAVVTATAGSGDAATAISNTSSITLKPTAKKKKKK